MLADPPYDLDPHPALALLATWGWLADGAVVALERSVGSAPVVWPAGLAEVRERRYGQSVVRYARAVGEDGPVMSP